MNLIGQCLRGNLRHFKPCCVTRLFYHDKLTEKSEGNDRSQQTANKNDRVLNCRRIHVQKIITLILNGSIKSSKFSNSIYRNI